MNALFLLKRIHLEQVGIHPDLHLLPCAAGSWGQMAAGGKTALFPEFGGLLPKEGRDKADDRAS